MLNRFDFPSKAELDKWELNNKAKIAAYDFWDKAISNAMGLITVAIVIFVLMIASYQASNRSKQFGLFVSC